MAIATLGVVVLDCPDPEALAGFYARVLGGEVISDADGSALRQGDRVLLAFQHSPGYTAPEWPRADRSQQLHLDLELPLEELEAAHEQVVSWGAKLLDDGGGDRSWRVFADPAGHPFCLCGVRS